MLARITKVEDDDEDNPLDLSNGMGWFMVDAIEERSRTSLRQVGQGTVSSSNVNPTTYNFNQGL